MIKTSKIWKTKKLTESERGLCLRRVGAGGSIFSRVSGWVEVISIERVRGFILESREEPMGSTACADTKVGGGGGSNCTTLPGAAPCGTCIWTCRPSSKLWEANRAHNTQHTAHCPEIFLPKTLDWTAAHQLRSTEKSLKSMTHFTVIRSPSFRPSGIWICMTMVSILLNPSSADGEALGPGENPRTWAKPISGSMALPSQNKIFLRVVWSENLEWKQKSGLFVGFFTKCDSPI